MKTKYKYLSLIILLVTALWSCKKEEVRSVDPMLKGISSQAIKTAEALNSGSWSNALIGLREQRIKLFGIKKLIAENKYKGGNYNLKDPALATKQIEETIVIITSKLDSVWNANIKNDFDALNPNSAGIKSFGLTAYNAASSKLTQIYAWLKLESQDGTTTPYIPNDLVEFQNEIATLKGLNALNETEVLAFVSNIKAKFAEMKQQYANLAAPVSSSPFFSKAQKALYVSINQPLIDMEAIINTKLSLATKDQLDAIDRDLSALVFFVANNYTSPAQKPLVFGQISSITEWRWLSEVSTKEERTNDWKLTTDIDAAETIRWNSTVPAKGFQQIETFQGTFDGQNHIISGLYMTKYSVAGSNRSGVFHNITGTIKNLGFVNLFIKSTDGGGGQGGSLFGWMTNGSVINCFVHGTMELNTQSGGFLGRTAGVVNVENSFSAVNTNANGAGTAGNTGSFAALPTGTISLKNCYTIGANPNRVIFGFPSGLVLSSASGIFYDPLKVGVTVLDSGPSGYSAASPVKITDAGVVTALPTAQWNNLSNFPGFASGVWEIKTVTEIDANPRPYLKGFNYDLIKDFIKR